MFTERGTRAIVGLQEHAERWLASQGARILQVKTIAATAPSPEYAETRRFYAALGYVPAETCPGHVPGQRAVALDVGPHGKGS
jgi:hypothetical protein